MLFRKILNFDIKWPKGLICGKATQTKLIRINLVCCYKKKTTAYINSAFHFHWSNSLLTLHTVSSVVSTDESINGTPFRAQRLAAWSHSLGFSGRLEILLLSSVIWFLDRAKNRKRRDQGNIVVVGPGECLFLAKNWCRSCTEWTGALSWWSCQSPDACNSVLFQRTVSRKRRNNTSLLYSLFTVWPGGTYLWWTTPL